MNYTKGWKKVIHLFKETFSGFINDNVFKLSAALSYYTVFSLPPLAIIITAFCGIYYGKVAIRGDFHEQIAGFVDNKAALQIQELIKNVKLSTHNIFATVIGGVILVIVASGMFAEIQDSIDYIWGIRTKPKHGFRQFIMNRLMSFIMIGYAGLLLLVNVVISSLMDLWNKNLIISYSQETVDLYYLLNIILLFVFTTLFILVIFKTLSNGKVVFRECLIGASFTAALFMPGKLLMSAYFINLKMDSVYSTIGSVLLILVWVYYSAIILYFGAEFTKVYSRTYGSKIMPNKHTTLLEKPKGIFGKREF